MNPAADQHSPPGARARGYAAISVVTVLWAANFTIGKFGTRQFDPLFIAAVRILLTGAIFYAFLPRAERTITRADWRTILPMSVSGIALNHVCFAVGIAHTTPSHSAIIHALLPVTVGLMAWIVIRERQGPVALFGMALAVGGALGVVLSVPAEERRNTLTGDLVTTLGILGFSFYMVYGRRAIRTMGSYRVVTLAFLFAMPVMVPLVVYGAARTNWHAITWQGWAALGYMWLFSNMLAYRLHIVALSHLKTGEVAAFADIQPAIGIAISVLAGIDTLSTPLLIGAAVALAGVVLVQLRR